MKLFGFHVGLNAVVLSVSEDGGFKVFKARIAAEDAEAAKLTERGSLQDIPLSVLRGLTRVTSSNVDGLCVDALEGAIFIAANDGKQSY